MKDYRDCVDFKVRKYDITNKQSVVNSDLKNIYVLLGYFSTEYGKQLIWIGLCIPLILIILLFEAKFYEKYASIIYLISLISLAGLFVLGKNINVDELPMEGGEVDINGVKFQVMDKTDKDITVRLPNSSGDGWEYVKYPIKTKALGDGMVNDVNKMISTAKRIGVNASSKDEALNAIGGYLSKVNNIETSSNAFPPEFGDWLSRQFQVVLDGNGNIKDPGQLSNVTIKTADGEVVKDPENNAARLNGANLSGFNRSLTNDISQNMLSYVESQMNFLYQKARGQAVMKSIKLSNQKLNINPTTLTIDEFSNRH